MTNPVHDLMFGMMKAVVSPEEPQGGTITLSALPLPTVGYWVGGAASSLVYPSFTVVDGSEVRQWLKSRRTLYVGWWKDGDRIHLDWVSWYAARESAVAIGQLRGEAAIFDIAGQVEIRF